MPEVVVFFASGCPASKLNIRGFLRQRFSRNEKLPTPEYICLSANIKMSGILFSFIYQEKLILPFTLS
ncbi:hypothetical protein O3S81_05960 [Agrobacterium sp. SOY23]|uniref:hypothetical protein n=1 Tax=Agrobacterium sp. SOY23 TaxID=3014555 RepID=UPI0022AFBF32|nr:hypothetical protein [Agrobacterium sp. SOY23]MCZ4429238.1 hypothetical protein [Agrobacterium sp. SOY23]